MDLWEEVVAIEGKGVREEEVAWIRIVSDGS
jgi:hypothetical protein